MGTPKRYLTRLIGISAGVLLALWIWPATRWLIRAQLAIALPAHSSMGMSCPAGFVSADSLDARRTATLETAAQHPDDFLFQLAVAVAPNAASSRLTSAATVQHLRALEARFPDRPSLYANALRFASLYQVVIHRNEPAVLMGDPAPTRDLRGQPQDSSPEQLAAFDHDAVEGERMDPNNAYFPLMRAVGLFAANRDDEALAAISRAGQKTAWKEYWNDELEGEWQAQEATCGHISALARADRWGAILYPHLRAVRAASSLAIFKAAEAEQAGRIEEGLAIRRAVRSYADLLRQQSPSVIASLVGISLGQVSILRPGGAPARGSGSASPAIQQALREQRIRDFDAYLRRTGHAGDVAGLHAQLAAGTQARQIVMLGIGGEPWASTRILCAWWVADLLLLSNALWMLIVGGAAALLMQHRRIRSGSGLPSPARRGFAIGALAAGILAVITILYGALPAPGTWLLCTLLGGLLALILPAPVRTERLRGLGAFCTTLAVLAGLGAIYDRQTTGMLTNILPIVQLYQNIVSNPEQEGFSRTLGPLLCGSGIAVPFLLLIALGILSLRWRVPLSVGLSRGLRGCAAPLTCVLVLGYAVLVPVTARLERVVDAGLKHCATQEGRCLAESIGKAWPGSAP